MELEAKEKLISEYKFSQIQAQSILDMRLQKLTGLEIQKLVDEYNEVIKTIEKLKSILESDIKQYNIIKDELSQIKENFSDVRKTKLVNDTTDINIEDLIKDEMFAIMTTRQDYIKKVSLDQYRTQKRGGKGNKCSLKI